MEVIRENSKFDAFINKIKQLRKSPYFILCTVLIIGALFELYQLKYRQVYAIVESNKIKNSDLDELIAYGQDGDLCWSIDEDGLLTVAGMGDYEDDPDWKSYNSRIITAKIYVTDITNCQEMFDCCYYLTDIDVSKMDTSKTTSMYGMFYLCESLESIDLSHFDTSNVTDMGDMFYSCEKLKSVDLSSFDTSKVKNMDSMFRDCPILKSIDLSNFDTSNVTDIDCMFKDCSNLNSLKIHFIINEDCSTYSVFDGCSCLDEDNNNIVVTYK